MLAEILKNETRSAHKQLDQHPLLVKLLQPNLSTETYTLILSGMYGIQFHCESTLDAAADKFIDHEYFHLPSRLPLLAEDLRQLHSVSTATITNKQKLSCNSIGAYVGMAYVLEGSALGGQHIARYLSKSSPHFPTQFFSSQNMDCKNRWATFWEFANQYCLASDIDSAISSALKTFHFYEQHMDFCLCQ